MESVNRRSWSRRRLLIRSILSVTLPIGWAWAAATALIPYLLIGHGSGSSVVTMFGLTRATWMSLHVWSTITIGLLTMGHVLLNRKGVARSIRIAAGSPHPESTVRPKKRSRAWVGAIALILAVTLGGFLFAAIDDTHGNADGRGQGNVASLDVEGAADGGGRHGNGRR